MRRRIRNLEALAQSIKPFLNEYLAEHEIDTNNHFNCINPKHTDTNASMSVGGDTGYHVANCFGCSTSCDIFAAAHYLENKPMKGPGFIEQNLLYLAEKFGVKAELEDLTPEEVYEFRTYEAYKFVASLIKDRSFGDYSLVDKEIERRGWDKDKCSSWGIGTVNYKEYKEKLKAAGYDVSFLSGIDLDRPNLFDKHNLLFTVYDDFGRPVGFSAKNLRHNGNKESGPKYINTRGTGLECAIFKKGERLYGYDIAKDANSPLYIFEGQADVITARHHGLMNCCCSLGTSLTDHHINLLKKHGTFNIVLVFDSDEAGEKAALKAIDEKFSSEKDFRVKLVQLPEGQDPDELLRGNGIDEFIRLKKWTAFEWRMMQFMNEAGDDIDDEKSQEIAQKMSRIIVTEKSHIQQEQMAKQVSRMTGYSLATIMTEVKRLRNEKEADIQSKKKALVESMLHEMRTNPDDIEITLTECQTALADINKETEDFVSGKGMIDFVLSQKEHDENRTSEFAGYKMRPEGLGNIAARLDDDWKSGSLIFIGGGEQAGKTTFCTQMAYETAFCNDDTICIYHSIDDAAKFILYKWICQSSNQLKLELNNVSNPNYWAAQEGYDFVPKMREEAYKQVISLMQSHRLVLFDATNGNSFSYAESIIKQYRDMYPSRKILFFGDNFHKYPDFSEMNGHERTKRMSNHVKNMSLRIDGLSTVFTAEYKKLMPGEKPTNLAMAESRALQYDASVIIHLFNELHHSGEHESILIHKDENGRVLPRIWAKFGKNKVSGYEGREFLDLYPSNATYRSVTIEQAEQDQKARVAYIRENSNNIV